MPVIVRKFIRKLRPVTIVGDLTQLGDPKIIQASGVTAGGQKSISVDIPAGPLPNSYWILEYIAALYSDASGAVPDNILSGFSVVPVGQSAVNDPANWATTPADLQDRFIFLEPTFGEVSVGGGITYVAMSIVGLKVVIPYGYTIRSVITGQYNSATVLGNGNTLFMGGLVRIVNTNKSC